MVIMLHNTSYTDFHKNLKMRYFKLQSKHSQEDQTSKGNDTVILESLNIQSIQRLYIRRFGSNDKIFQEYVS